MAMNPNEQNNNHEAVPKENMWKRQEDNNWAEKLKAEERRKRTITNIIFWVCLIAIVGGIVTYALLGGFHVHEFGDEYIVREATCQNNGIMERACKCGEVKQRELIGDHIPLEIDGKQQPVCIICSKHIQLSSIGLNWKMNEDYTITIIGIGSCTDSEIIIPKIIAGGYVTGIADKAFYKWNEPNTQITSITIPDTVTNIGAFAFANCYSLKSVTIPNSVTTIGEYAFSGCTSLASITIPYSVTSVDVSAFQGCTVLESIEIDENNENYKSIDGNLYDKDVKILLRYAVGKQDKSFVIPDSVTSIGGDAFANCTSLKIIEIPDSVTCIENMAFRDCTSLTSIEIPDSVTSIGDFAFDGCTSLTSIEIPDSVTSIGEHAFYGCTSLTSIEIPDSVTSIGISAFHNCTALKDIYYTGNIEDWLGISLSIGGLPDSNLYFDGNLVTNVVIPESVTSIGSYAFSGCSSLTSIEISDSVTSIGYSAFEDCTSLTSVEIGNSVMSIGGWAFANCTSLKIIEIPDSVTCIEGMAFRGCTSLTSIEIPDSVTRIDSQAFDDCTSLTSVEIGNSVTSIGSSAFEDCTSLKSIEIPDSVTCIENSAFRGCTSLTSIEIPDSVTRIGSQVFEDCTSLTSIDIPNSVTYIDVWVFRGCTSLTSINYSGTKAQWNNIVKYKDLDDGTGDYIVYCTDGKITKQ